MEKKENIPLWVFLAFSSIKHRSGALWLIASCIVFMLYCVPWTQYNLGPAWMGKVLLIKDWDWFAWTAPITLWYYLSLRWVDKHNAWEAE